MQKDTSATAMAKRYWPQIALSIKKADTSQATVPVSGGWPAKLAEIKPRNTTLGGTARSVPLLTRIFGQI